MTKKKSKKPVPGPEERLAAVEEMLKSQISAAEDAVRNLQKERHILEERQDAYQDNVYALKDCLREVKNL